MSTSSLNPFWIRAFNIRLSTHWYQRIRVLIPFESGHSISVLLPLQPCQRHSLNPFWIRAFNIRQRLPWLPRNCRLNPFWIRAFNIRLGPMPLRDAEAVLIPFESGHSISVQATTQFVDHERLNPFWIRAFNIRQVVNGNQSSALVLIPFESGHSISDYLTLDQIEQMS